MTRRYPIDNVAFETWLSAIVRLSAEQRGAAFRALALAEANAPADDLPRQAQAEAAATPPVVLDANSSAPEESLSAMIGRVRNESFGCPHCGLRDIRPWGHAGGKPRYRCDAVLPGLDAASMTAALGSVIARGSDFCCDAGSGITAFARRARLKLHVLPAPGGPLHRSSISTTSTPIMAG